MLFFTHNQWFKIDNLQTFQARFRELQETRRMRYGSDEYSITAISFHLSAMWTSAADILTWNALLHLVCYPYNYEENGQNTCADVYSNVHVVQSVEGQMIRYKRAARTANFLVDCIVWDGTAK